MENILKEYSKLLDNTGSHLSYETLATYLNLEENLSRKEKKFIIEHLLACDSCNERLGQIRKEDLEIDPVMGFSDSKRINKSYWYAAAAVLIIAIGLGYLILFSPGNEQRITQNQNLFPTDSLLIDDNPDKPSEENTGPKEDVKPKYNTEDFAANQVLENFINRNIRSESHTKIISPSIGDTVKIPVNFIWESKVDEFGFSIVDNKNKQIFESTVKAKQISVDKNLKPGLYYWKIIVDEKIESVGKFFIK